MRFLTPGQLWSQEMGTNVIDIFLKCLGWWSESDVTTGPQEQITSLMEFICSEQLGHRIGEKQIENDRNIMTYGHDCCDTNDERVTQE